MLAAYGRQILTVLAILPMFGQTATGQAEGDVYPAPLLKLGHYFNRHVLIAEKSTHRLHLYKNEEGEPQHIKTYKMMTGKVLGNKRHEGDHKTPEGIYFFIDFIHHRKLIQENSDAKKLYGVGAFVTNYPNPIDNLNKKTGSGIWLHSTSDESRIDKKLDSRGCLVTNNKDLIEISDYIDIDRTTIVVVQDLHYIDEVSWKKAKGDLHNTLTDWVTAWRQENLAKYISFYHHKFRDSAGRSISGYRRYKRAIFNKPGKPQIEIKDLSIIQSGQYAMIVFKQQYSSTTINDTGRKVLYLQKDDEYNWRIVSEQWSKRGINQLTNNNLTAKSKFFQTNSPELIFKQGRVE